jgi:phosphoglucomutase
MKGQYLEMASSLSTRRELNAASDLVFTYTAMHGVGLPFASAAFRSFGFKRESFSVVEEQGQPDPRFPTVRFPNPEEKGELHVDRLRPS